MQDRTFLIPEDVLIVRGLAMALICAKCASKGHASENCGGSLHCANCEVQHSAYSRHVRPGRKKKNITIKTKENISFKEARKRFSLMNSFSSQQK